jgi:hypothetical protein
MLGEGVLRRVGEDGVKEGGYRVQVNSEEVNHY